MGCARSAVPTIGSTKRNTDLFKNLVEKGDLSQPLILFNRTNTRAEQLSEKLGKDKTKVAKSIEDAVTSADIIFTCVGDDKAMEETVDSILKGEVKGKVHPRPSFPITYELTSRKAHLRLLHDSPRHNQQNQQSHHR